jgi:hypothetical protein
MGDGSCNKNSFLAGSSVFGRDMKHKENDAPDGS